MFAALLFPEVKKSKNILAIFFISGILYAVLYYSKLFASGWDIILAIIIASALGVLIFDHKEEESEN